MLSLVGSIQPDPFSPEHVPKAPVTTATSSSQRTKAPSQPPSAHPSEREVDAMMAEAEAEEDSEDEDLDPDFDDFGGGPYNYYYEMEEMPRGYSDEEDEGHSDDDNLYDNFDW